MTRSPSVDDSPPPGSVGVPPPGDAAFLEDLSHEIRNPLNGIVAMADLLAHSNLADDQRQCVQTILTAAEALVATADSLLGRIATSADAAPMSPSPAPRPAANERPEPVTGSTNVEEAPDARPAGPVRVLVAEDNATNQLVVRSLLERLGHACTIVENGRLAVEAVGESHYDLVLMDCMMPELDGFDATREIRALDRPVAKIPIVALTANAMKGDREKCLNAGMDEYMPKPVRRDLLAEMIERFGPDRSTD